MERQRLSKAAAQVRSEASKMLKRPRKMSNSEWQLYKGTASAQQNHVQKRNRAILSRLENMAPKEKPEALPVVSMKLNPAVKIRSKTAVRLQEFHFSYGSTTVFEHFSIEIAANQKTFVTGCNGSGKSTLLRCIVNGADGIEVAPDATVGYFSQQLDVLDPAFTVLENVRRSAAVPEPVCRAVLRNLNFQAYDLHKKAAVLSGGEKVKTQLAMLLVSGCNFLVLDEPTNYLDIDTLEGFERLLADYDGTLLLVSHDRRFLEKTAQRRVCLDEKEFTNKGNVVK